MIQNNPLHNPRRYSCRRHLFILRPDTVDNGLMVRLARSAVRCSCMVRSPANPRILLHACMYRLHTSESPYLYVRVDWIASTLKEAVETAAARQTGEQPGADTTSGTTAAAAVTAVVRLLVVSLRRTIRARLGRVRSLATGVGTLLLLLVVVAHRRTGLVVTGSLTALLLLVRIGRAVTVRSAAVGRLGRSRVATVGGRVIVLRHGGLCGSRGSDLRRERESLCGRRGSVLGKD